MLHVHYSNPEMLVAVHSLLYFMSKQAIKFYPFFNGVSCYYYLLRLERKRGFSPFGFLFFLLLFS